MDKKEFKNKQILREFLENFSNTNNIDISQFTDKDFASALKMIRADDFDEETLNKLLERFK